MQAGSAFQMIDAAILEPVFSIFFPEREYSESAKGTSVQPGIVLP